MQIRIAGYEPESIVDGPGYRFAVFAQGCPHGCPECHNPQTHDAFGGKLVDTQEIIVLDVREQDEFDAGHIPGAVLLPVGAITADAAAAVIPASDSVVLVYCRSGNRSKTASKALADLGYTRIYEFGGINTWPYDIVQ